MEKQNRRQNNKIETKVMKNQGRKENRLFFFFFFGNISPYSLGSCIIYPIQYNLKFCCLFEKKTFHLALIQKLNVEQNWNYLNGQRFVCDYRLFYYEWKVITKRSSNFIEYVNVRYAEITAFSDKYLHVETHIYSIDSFIWSPLLLFYSYNVLWNYFYFLHIYQHLIKISYSLPSLKILHTKLFYDSKMF